MNARVGGDEARPGIGRWLVPLVAGLVGVGVGAGGMTMLGGAAQKGRVEAIVHAYLLDHPEILPQAMDRLRSKQNAAMVRESGGDALEKPYAGAWMGAADGDVVLVEFTDYNCGYCRASLPVVDRLIAEDPNLKVVFREYPILSEESVTAARVALAAAAQGKYAAFHGALFAAGTVTPETIAAAQTTAGLDAAAVQAAIRSPQIDAELGANHGFAKKLEFTGTPSWVVGDQILQGAVGYEALKKAIADARGAKG